MMKMMSGRVDVVSRVVRRARNAKRSRGAALVEAAIIILPLWIVLFGIVEYGFVFKDALTISSATRAGARTGAAATGSLGEVMFPAIVAAVSNSASAAQFTDEDEMRIYLADSNGNPYGDASCGGGMGSNTCVVYAYSYSEGWKLKSVSMGWQPETAASCLGNGPLDSIGVSLTLHHRAVTSMFPLVDNMVLKDKSIMNFEPTSSTTTGCL